MPKGMGIQQSAPHWREIKHLEKPRRDGPQSHEQAFPGVRTPVAPTVDQPHGKIDDDSSHGYCHVPTYTNATGQLGPKIPEWAARTVVKLDNVHVRNVERHGTENHNSKAPLGSCSGERHSTHQAQEQAVHDHQGRTMVVQSFCKPRVTSVEHGTPQPAIHANPRVRPHSERHVVTVRSVPPGVAVEQVRNAVHDREHNRRELLHAKDPCESPPPMVLLLEASTHNHVRNSGQHCGTAHSTFNQPRSTYQSSSGGFLFVRHGMCTSVPAILIACPSKHANACRHMAVRTQHRQWSDSLATLGRTAKIVVGAPEIHCNRRIAGIPSRTAGILAHDRHGMRLPWRNK